jgi:hypothetical protein
MVQRAQLDVSKWQASRPGWNYTPVLWFYHRTLYQAWLDACSMRERQPTDAALLARDWIARSEPAPALAPHEYVSFPECCRILGLNPDAERADLLERIDRIADFDTDETWERLEALSAAEPSYEPEVNFNAFRVVPALDQGCLFAT